VTVVPERRVFAGSLLEVREDGDGRTVTGLAAPYHQPTPIGDRFIEMLVPGSFDLERSAVPLHGGHDSELPVSPPGRMWESREGLMGEWRVSDTTAGRDLLTLLRDNAVGALSVSFWPNPDADEWSQDRSVVTRYGAELRHVAVVTHPAYPAAKVLSLRSAQPQFRVCEACGGLDGNHVFPAFRGTDTVDVRQAAKRPYRDVKHADPGYQEDGKSRYPLDTGQHVRSAWAYIHKAHNAEMYTAQQLVKIKNRIRAAADHYGITLSEGGVEEAAERTHGRAARQLVECRARLYHAQDRQFPRDPVKTPWQAYLHLDRR
jgi:HK97 family phage prohead protease